MERTVEINNITKVEGHARLFLNIAKNGEILRCELESIEGARYFEGMLKGRLYYEASEIASRICGICSCAHVAASITAIERALGITVTPQTRILRELFTMGERIRSHVTHMYFLSLPDYLGAESGMDLAKTHRDEVLRALRLMKLGNDMVTCFAGRDLHPVSATIGGFLHVPKQEQIDSIRKRLEDSLPDAVAAAKLFGTLKYPSFAQDAIYCSLRKEGEYPMMEGDLYCSTGETYPQDRFDDFFKEYHEERSTANFITKEGRSYVVGALARINNNYGFFSDTAKRIAEEAGVSFPTSNPFLIPFCQALEVVHFMERAIRTLETFKVADEKTLPFTVKAGKGTGIIEVPRGLLIHEYALDEQGIITKANIVTPTVQNLRTMEDDIKRILPTVMHLGNQELVLEIEKLIRSYDPCFSCSTHFLEVNWEGHRARD